MRAAVVRPDGTKMRWVELPGAEPARVYLHGYGASAAPYYAEAVAHPALAGRRSLLMDLLGHGISDRPADAAYTMEEHADHVAAAMRAATVAGADVIGHSMGGSIAIVLAARHPELVSRLVLVDAPLDGLPPGAGLQARHGSEQEFLHSDGLARELERAGEHWAATMRLAGPQALYRSGVHLGRGSTPVMRELLLKLTVARTFLYPAGKPPSDARGLAAAGVELVEIAESGHNIMLDNRDAFAEATAAALR